MKNSFLLPHLQKLMTLGNWPNASVPIMSQINEYIPWMAKVPFDYLFRDDPVGMAECTLLVHEYIGVDDLGSNLDVYNFEVESMGAKINFYSDHIPDVNRNDFLVKSEEDLEIVKFNGLSSGRYPYMTAYIDAYKEYTGLETMPSMCAPWTMACNLYGLENLIVATLEDPDFVHAFLKKIVTEVQIPLIRALHEKYTTITSISYADAFASPPMTNGDIREEFIEPYNDMLQNLAKEEGIAVTIAGYFFVSRVPEEDRESYLKMLTKAGQNVAMVFDPDVQSLGADYLRDYANHNLCGLLLGLSNNILVNDAFCGPQRSAMRLTAAAMQNKTAA